MNRASNRSYNILLVTVITIAMTIRTNPIVFDQKSMAQGPPLIPKSTTTASAPTNVTKAAPTNATTANNATQLKASNATIPTQGNATTTATNMTTTTTGNITTSTKPTANTTQPESSNLMGGRGQNQTNIMMGANLTGSILIGPTIAKAIASQVHIGLANASTAAENAVGTNAHAADVRLGVVHGFLVYMALGVDGDNNFHGVLVDAGNGKVLASTQMSTAAMEQSGMGINLMGPGMMGPGMMGPGMMQHGMIQGPGMLRSYP